jgi:hypothetical protein
MGRRIAAFAALTLAAGLAGCAHEKVASTGYQWVYMEAAGDSAPRLAYGLPNSDELVMMLNCQPGADRLEVMAVGLPGDAIALASGGAQSRLPAVHVEDELNDGGALRARTTSRDAALAGFRKSGELALLVGNERHDLAARSADRRRVRAFFTACGV